MKLYDKRNELFRLTDAMKVISRVGFDEAEFTKFLRTVDAINDLNADDVTFKGRSLDLWKIPSGLKPLFKPAAISLTNEITAKDLLFRAPVLIDHDEVMDYDEFFEFCCKLFNSQRAVMVPDTTLAEVRKRVTLDTVAHCICDDDMVNFSEQPFLPIQLINGGMFFKSYFFNMEASEMIKELWKMIIRGIHK